MYQIIKNSDDIKSGKIKAITKAQRTKWNEYCKKYPKQQTWD